MIRQAVREKINKTSGLRDGGRKILPALYGHKGWIALSRACRVPDDLNTDNAPSGRGVNRIEKIKKTPKHHRNERAIRRKRDGASLRGYRGWGSA